MIVKAWNGGNNRAGYGIRIYRRDREQYFREEWKDIQIRIAGGHEFICSLAPSFWGTCSEIRSIAFRELFAEMGCIKKTRTGWERIWKKRKPPKFYLTPTSGRHFTLKKCNN